MNVIIAYLETMFGAYPQSPRLLEAKAELQTMMEDAYAGFISSGLSENEAVGRVITEFGNLDELAPVLGIAAEITPVTAAEGATPDGTPSGPPAITLPEATGYADAMQRVRYRRAIAVALFVLSPIPLIVLPTAAQLRLIGISESIAAAVGIAALLLAVASGVIVMIGTSREVTQFERVHNGRFSRNPEVTRWADSLEQQHERQRIGALQISILLWIFAAAPLILLALLTEASAIHDFWTVVGVGLVLVFVAAGLLVLLPATWASSAAQKLGHSTSIAASDEEHSIIGVIAPFYWPLLTAGYLAWSFITGDWGRTWIVWPIGTVLFGALAGGIGAWENYRRKNAA